MAYSEKEILSTGAAIAIVAAFLALFVGVFLFVSNQYGGTGHATVAQHETTPAQPGNELPLAPPAAPPAAPLSATPPATR